MVKSPSSRRAWIEITMRQGASQTTKVALLTEGVDRNANLGEQPVKKKESPSSRRAWIEIEPLPENYRSNKSPSSRRAWIEIMCILKICL